MTAEWGGAGSLDEKMIADLRAWRDRITLAPSEAEHSAGHPYSVQIRLEELDALLAAVADRDALRREACEMPDEGPLASVRLAPVVAIVNGRRLRDVTTKIDAAVEADERVIAWDAIAAHPFFRDCYGAKTSLLEAMLAKLTASTFTAEIPDEVRERAAALPAGHALVDGVVVPLPAEPRPAGSTALGIPYERPRLRDVVADALGEGACSCYESVPKQVERIALAIEREIAAGGIS
jgi:hypothetical protein